MHYQEYSMYESHFERITSKQKDFITVDLDFQNIIGIPFADKDITDVTKAQTVELTVTLKEKEVPEYLVKKPMTDETIKPNAEDGDNVNEIETKEVKEKPRVSFNRDVHVKRFGESMLALVCNSPNLLIIFDPLKIDQICCIFFHLYLNKQRQHKLLPFWFSAYQLLLFLLCSCW